MKLAEAFERLAADIALKVFERAGVLGTITFEDWLDVANVQIKGNGGNNIHEVVLEQLCNKAVTFDNLFSVLTVMRGRSYRGGPDSADYKVDPRHKLLNRLVEEAQNFQQCLAAVDMLKKEHNDRLGYRPCPEPEQKSVLLSVLAERAVRFASSFEEWLWVIEWTGRGSEALALSKMRELASSPEEWERYYRRVKPSWIKEENELSEAALDKLVELVVERPT